MASRPAVPFPSREMRAHYYNTRRICIRIRTYVRASSLSLSASLPVPWGEVVVVGIAPALSVTQEKPILSLCLSLSPLSTRTNILLPGGERERCIVSGRGGIPIRGRRRRRFQSNKRVPLYRELSLPPVRISGFLVLRSVTQAKKVLPVSCSRRFLRKTHH